MAQESIILRYKFPFDALTATDVECLLSFFFFCTCFQLLRQPDTSPSLHLVLFYLGLACVSALAASSLFVLRLPRL